ncbi:hypothetical protein HYH03_016351 [Edaphochlamys debaryana]|uniref:Protein kinase domain-containing protein n=1 Tax=Edaphochlamys debaryana TaxID=47281 RepID=A0A835XPX7_9CHLO|nr:hypothetical protein HYH03_016351 [Edaphochlamys debaryana]|eukprot:KAG2484865.1 hypothetical protein HYH03_016351 [Edaphochlamys debaryana]
MTRARAPALAWALCCFGGPADQQGLAAGQGPSSYADARRARTAAAGSGAGSEAAVALPEPAAGASAPAQTSRASSSATTSAALVDRSQPEGASSEWSQAHGQSTAATTPSSHAPPRGLSQPASASIRQQLLAEPSGELSLQLRQQASAEPSSSVRARSGSTRVEGEDLDPRIRIPFAEISLFKVIGKGTFKTVYRGSWNNTHVAVVSMRRGGLVAEARLLQRLSTHPNLVQLYRWSTDDAGNEYLVMELLQLGSLDAVLRSIGRSLLTQTKMTIVGQVVSACLELSHEGLVHGDLAARNVLVKSLDPPHVKLADFGLARRATPLDAPTPALGTSAASASSVLGAAVGASNAPSASGGMSSHGGYHGSDVVPARWAAPEVLAGGPLSEAADVWSFGVTCWEIFANGAEPYSNMDNRQVLMAVRSGARLERPRGCPLELWELILRCWSADFRDRPRFADIATTLRTWRQAYACSKAGPSRAGLAMGGPSTGLGAGAGAARAGLPVVSGSGALPGGPEGYGGAGGQAHPSGGANSSAALTQGQTSLSLAALAPGLAFGNLRSGAGDSGALQADAEAAAVIAQFVDDSPRSSAMPAHTSANRTSAVFGTRRSPGVAPRAGLLNPLMTGGPPDARASLLMGSGTVGSTGAPGDRPGAGIFSSMGPTVVSTHMSFDIAETPILPAYTSGSSIAMTSGATSREQAYTLQASTFGGPPHTLSPGGAAHAGGSNGTSGTGGSGGTRGSIGTPVPGNAIGTGIVSGAAGSAVATGGGSSATSRTASAGQLGLVPMGPADSLSALVVPGSYSSGVRAKHVLAGHRRGSGASGAAGYTVVGPGFHPPVEGSGGAAGNSLAPAGGAGAGSIPSWSRSSAHPTTTSSGNNDRSNHGRADTRSSVGRSSAGGGGSTAGSGVGSNPGSGGPDPRLRMRRTTSSVEAVAAHFAATAGVQQRTSGTAAAPPGRAAGPSVASAPHASGLGFTLQPAAADNPSSEFAPSTIFGASIFNESVGPAHSNDPASHGAASNATSQVIHSGGNSSRHRATGTGTGTHSGGILSGATSGGRSVEPVGLARSSAAGSTGMRSGGAGSASHRSTGGRGSAGVRSSGTSGGVGAEERQLSSLLEAPSAPPRVPPTAAAWMQSTNPSDVGAEPPAGPSATAGSGAAHMSTTGSDRQATPVGMRSSATPSGPMGLALSRSASAAAAGSSSPYVRIGELAGQPPVDVPRRMLWPSTSAGQARTAASAMALRQGHGDASTTPSVSPQRPLLRHQAHLAQAASLDRSPFVSPAGPGLGPMGLGAAMPPIRESSTSDLSLSGMVNRCAAGGINIASASTQRSGSNDNKNGSAGPQGPPAAALQFFRDASAPFGSDMAGTSTAATALLSSEADLEAIASQARLPVGAVRQVLNMSSLDERGYRGAASAGIASAGAASASTMLSGSGDKHGGSAGRPGDGPPAAALRYFRAVSGAFGSEIRGGSTAATASVDADRDIQTMVSQAGSVSQRVARISSARSITSAAASTLPSGSNDKEGSSGRRGPPAAALRFFRAASAATFMSDTPPVATTGAFLSDTAALGGLAEEQVMLTEGDEGLEQDGAQEAAETRMDATAELPALAVPLELSGVLAVAVKTALPSSTGSGPSRSASNASAPVVSGGTASTQVTGGAALEGTEAAQARPASDHDSATMLLEPTLPLPPPMVLPEPAQPLPAVQPQPVPAAAAAFTYEPVVPASLLEAQAQAPAPAQARLSPALLAQQQQRLSSRVLRVRRGSNGSRASGSARCGLSQSSVTNSVASVVSGRTNTGAGPNQRLLGTAPAHYLAAFVHQPEPRTEVPSRLLGTAPALYGHQYSGPSPGPSPSNHSHQSPADAPGAAHARSGPTGDSLHHFSSTLEAADLVQLRLPPGATPAMSSNARSSGLDLFDELRMSSSSAGIGAAADVHGLLMNSGANGLGGASGPAGHPMSHGQGMSRRDIQLASPDQLALFSAALLGQPGTDSHHHESGSTHSIVPQQPPAHQVRALLVSRGTQEYERYASAGMSFGGSSEAPPGRSSALQRGGSGGPQFHAMQGSSGLDFSRHPMGHVLVDHAWGQAGSGGAGSGPAGAIGHGLRNMPPSSRHVAGPLIDVTVVHGAGVLTGSGRSGSTPEAATGGEASSLFESAVDEVVVERQAIFHYLSTVQLQQLQEDRDW